MPKLKSDWESEYRDPISDEEDELQKAIEEQQNVEIMADIELCRQMEEDRELAAKERELYEQELYNYLDDFYEDAEYAYEHYGSE